MYKMLKDISNSVRNILTTITREPKRLYYEKSFEEVKNNSKKNMDAPA